MELKHIDPVGIALMLLGGVLGYGSRWIVTYALKPPQEKLLNWTVAVKLMGLIFAILGMLKIMEVF